MTDMVREIVLDTETTGLSPDDGHRIIEIGALELINHMPTGKKCHLYINPEREIDVEAERVHGLSGAFLADKPVFTDIVDEFLDFIQNDKLIIHNAPFDMGFINAELKWAGKTPLPADQAIDTLVMARKKFPGAQASLDALCRRFAIDNSHRDLHGALIDADLLAEVYIELTGGRQPDLGLGASQAAITASQDDSAAATQGFTIETGPLRPARPHAVSAAEKEAHDAFIETLSDPIWRQSSES